MQEYRRTKNGDCTFNNSRTSLFGTRFSLFSLLVLLLLVTGCHLSDSESREFYGLFYGVAQYEIIQDLTFTDDDAVSMASLFSEWGYTTTLRLNEDATKKNLESDLSRLADDMGPEDTFVLYFSGHGGRHFDFYGTYAKTPGNEPPYADSDDEWILFYGSLQDLNFETWSNTAVNDDQLQEMLSVLPTKKKMVIIDACNSGGFIHNFTDTDAVPPNYTKNILENRDNVFQKAVALYGEAVNGSTTDLSYEDAVVLSASGEQEYSVELHSIEHGLFTYFFLETPQEGDINGDGYITITECYAYVAAAIDFNWNDNGYPTYNYHPHITGGPMDYVIFSKKGE